MKINPKDFLSYFGHTVIPIKTITTDEFFYWRVNANYFGIEHGEYCHLLDNTGYDFTWDYEDIIVLKKSVHPEYYL